MNGNPLSQGDIIAKEIKYTQFLKIFSRTSKPISIKLGIHHP
jgi:hypothetical protein